MFKFKRHQDYTFIEFNRQEIKIAEYTAAQPGRPCLTKFCTGERPPATELTDYLKKIFASYGFNKDNVAVLIGSADVYVKLYECPLFQAAEIRQALAWDEVFWSPFQSEKAYADFVILNGNPAGRSRLLAVLVQRTFVDEILTALELIGVAVSGILCSQLEVLNLIDEADYTYIECQSNGLMLFTIKDAALTNFTRVDTADYLTVLFELVGKLEAGSCLIVGGSHKESLLEILKRGEIVAIDIENYRQLIMANDLAEEYIQPHLSDYICGAASRVYR